MNQKLKFLIIAKNQLSLLEVGKALEINKTLET